MAETTSPSKQDADVLVLPRAEPSIDYTPHLWKFISSSLIRIHVGSEGSVQRVFNVHEGLLKSQSLFFRRMLRNNFAETNARLVRLPEDDVKTFAVFLQWLYTGKSHDREISASNLDVSQPEVEFTLTDLRADQLKSHEAQLLQTTKKGPSSSARLLFSSYIFADKIQAPWFKNHIHNQLIDAVNSVPCPLLTVSDIRYVYRNTQNGNEEDNLLRLCCLVMSCGPNLDSLLEDSEFLELCFEVKQFGVGVLKRCKTLIAAPAAPAAAPKLKGRRRGGL
ncbi:predicted protein [Histoplasma capsulatum var. duboisii H88]|uniref:Predicted protein n=1 Tax=Ajellomyces capsulatus (strain H88) TaxID=544711 RepID=F0UQD2_AJEC8|nr:predicted protein [Histoplasma capsulatum var. duboisii H88]